MSRLIAFVLTTVVMCIVMGCGSDEKSPKPASGGGGATSPATIKPQKGSLPKME